MVYSAFRSPVVRNYAFTYSYAESKVKDGGLWSILLFSVDIDGLSLIL